jgi:hypothetical protein
LLLASLNYQYFITVIHLFFSYPLKNRACLQELFGGMNLVRVGKGRAVFGIAGGVRRNAVGEIVKK